MSKISAEDKEIAEVIYWLAPDYVRPDISSGAPDVQEHAKKLLFITFLEFIVKVRERDDITPQQMRSEFAGLYLDLLMRQIETAKPVAKTSPQNVNSAQVKIPPKKSAKFARTSGSKKLTESIHPIQEVALNLACTFGVLAFTATGFWALSGLIGIAT